MIASFVAAMLVSSADPTGALLARAATRLTVEDCAGAACHPADASRYRVSRTVEREQTSKDRAFAADGQQCQVVGDKYCTHGGHTILSAPITND